VQFLLVTRLMFIAESNIFSRADQWCIHNINIPNIKITRHTGLYSIIEPFITYLFGM